MTMMIIVAVVCLVVGICIIWYLSKPIKMGRLPYSGVQGVCPKCRSNNVRTQTYRNENGPYLSRMCDDCVFEWEEYTP